MSSGGVFSDTLQQITLTKLEELAKKRKSFEQQKTATIEATIQKHDSLEMLRTLADGTRVCFGVATKDDRFIDQARFDPSVSLKIIEGWKSTLMRHLDTQSLRYQYADLYGQLTMEWLTSSTSAGSKKPTSDTLDADAMDLSNDFEEISVKAKLEARKAWEQTVFEEAKVDERNINKFLHQLFDDQNKDMQRAVEALRNEVATLESTLTHGNLFNHVTLRWSIRGLLASDLLTNEKRQVLRDFLSNDVVLTELADVLNMRLGSFDSWSWGREVAVEARRQLNGRYNIYMHEDLLQAIYLQYIGVSWSVRLKSALLNFQANTSVWKNGRNEPTPLDKQRRLWYLNGKHSGLHVQQIRGLSYRAGYFLSQLMDSVTQDLTVEEGDEEADFASFEASRDMDETKKKRARYAPQQPAMQVASKAARRSASRALFGAGGPAEESEDEYMAFGVFDSAEEPVAPIDLAKYKPKNSMDAKQRLLHLLSTDILLKTRLQGDFTCIRSGFTQWYPSLPHTTILSVLSFFGFSEKWLSFFKKFLQAPLRFMDEQEEAKIRKQGTPGAHVLSDVFGEMILFCLDYSVNQETDGEILWRMNDDIWFWSASHEKCIQVWKLVNDFARIMGVNMDKGKSAAVRMQRKNGSIVPARLDKSLPEGEIRWGMIYLNDLTGRFTIDEEMVDKHIEELRRQLKNKERSIFSWVQAYSTYASVFFTSNFGKPANCFGREHLDAMLGMHERIQKTLFSKSGDGVGSVVDWLKKQIAERFGVQDIPDGYLFFPTALGGLDVKSPFIGLLQLRESVTKDPQELFDRFEEAEEDVYNSAKKTYLERKAWEYPKRDKDYRPANPQQFMPFEEYIKFREDINYGFDDQLVQVYEQLLKRPTEDPVANDGNVEIADALNRLDRLYDAPTTITDWYSMDPYWKWVTMLYGPEMLNRFGGFQIVDPALLPMGMVGLFKSGRVRWQE